MKVLRELSNFVNDPLIVGGFLIIIVVSVLIWAAIWKRQTNGSYRPPKKT